MEMTFELAGRGIDLLAKQVMDKNESVDPQETLKLCLILETLWESLAKARSDLCALL